jgi:hypothetical protein
LRHRRLLWLLLAASFCMPTALRAQMPAIGGIEFHGFLFGDVTYIESQRSVPDGFLVGQLVGHGNAGLSPRLSLFGELSATARDAGYNIELERIILRYAFMDALKLSIGRYHTPISYWNTAYHHGLWLQTSVARPELIKMGGTFLPVHFVGALAEGELTLPGLSLMYGGGVGNGRASVVTRGGDAGDVNSSRAAVVTASVRPSLFGLTLGGSMYVDDVELTAGQVDERALSAHVAWTQGIPELIAEYVHVSHDQEFAAINETTSSGYYVHAGVKLGAFKPYGRIEEMRIAAGDELFAAVPDYQAQLVGLRWDFESLAALKTEFRRERIAGAERQNSLLIQVTFVLPSFMGM